MSAAGQAIGAQTGSGSIEQAERCGLYGVFRIPDDSVGRICVGDEQYLAGVQQRGVDYANRRRHGAPPTFLGTSVRTAGSGDREWRDRNRESSPAG